MGQWRGFCEWGWPKVTPKWFSPLFESLIHISRTVKETTNNPWFLTEAEFNFGCMYHLMAIFGDEALVVENAKCVDFAWTRTIMILVRNPRLRAEKALEQAVGLGIPLKRPRS